jgi:hypothetical protein
MAGAGKSPPKAVLKSKPLSEDDKAKIVHEYLGVHPKYFIYAGQQIRVNIFDHQRDGYNWRGWRIKEINNNREWRDEWTKPENL